MAFCSHALSETLSSLLRGITKSTFKRWCGAIGRYREIDGLASTRLDQGLDGRGTPLRSSWPATLGEIGIAIAIEGMGGAFGAEIEEDVMGIIEKSYCRNGKLPILPLALCGVERRKNVKAGLSQDNNNKLRRILATM